MRDIFAWIGGALFVAALVFGIYFYSWTLGDSPVSPAAGVAPGALVFDIALFTVFALHHSLLARTGMKAWVVRYVPPALERSVYVWVASLLFIAVCALWQRLPGTVWTVDGLGRWLLLAVPAAGIVLTVQAARLLDPLELAGIRQLHGALRPTILSATGPFGLVRHPIYLGWMLMVFGVPSMTMDRLVFASVSSLYLLLAIPWEERSLVATIGDPYRAYQRQVRWRVVPGIW